VAEIAVKKRCSRTLDYGLYFLFFMGFGVFGGPKQKVLVFFELVDITMKKAGL
jgi:hypothetical protein